MTTSLTSYGFSAWKDAFSATPFYRRFAEETLQRTIALHVRRCDHDPMRTFVRDEATMLGNIDMLTRPEATQLYDHLFRQAAFFDRDIAASLTRLERAMSRFAPLSQGITPMKRGKQTARYRLALSLIEELNAGDTEWRRSTAARRLSTEIPRFAPDDPERFDLAARILFMLNPRVSTRADPNATIRLFTHIVGGAATAFPEIFQLATRFALLDPLEKEMPEIVYEARQEDDKQHVITYPSAAHQVTAYRALIDRFGDDPYRLLDIAATFSTWSTDYFFSKKFGKRFFIRPGALAVFMDLAPRLRNDLMRKRLFTQTIKRLVEFKRRAYSAAADHQMGIAKDAAATLMILNGAYFAGPHGTLIDGKPLPASIETDPGWHPTAPAAWIRSGMLPIGTSGETGALTLSSALSLFRISLHP